MWFWFFVLVFLSGRFCKDVMEFYVFAGVNAWFVVDFCVLKIDSWWNICSSFMAFFWECVCLLEFDVLVGVDVWFVCDYGKITVFVFVKDPFFFMKKRWILCSIPSHFCCDFGICLIGSVLGWVFSMNMCWNLMCLQYRKCDLFVTFVKFLLL